MFVLPAAVGTYLLVNIVCACIALGVGFGAGVWFFGAKMAKAALPPTPVKRGPPKKKVEEVKKAAERIAMATSRVADLTTGVATDVGDHAAKMKAISADLAGIDREADGANAAVFTAMDQILAANTHLQQQLEAAEKQLAAQAAEIKAHESEARTDALTGLSNRRAFDSELKRRVLEWERKKIPVTLVLLDIDFFKKFNDTHGHLVGDEVLKQVAKTLREQARDTDVPCRYGGEEFGVILPNTDSQGACVVAERIRKAVEDSITQAEGKSLKVTCSLGVSQSGTDDDPAKIIRRADDALYRSKKAGRNCGHWTDGFAFHPICTPPAPSAGGADAGGEAADTPGENGSSARHTFIHMLKRRVTESHRFGVPLSLMHLKIEDYDSVAKEHGKNVARQMLDVAEPALEKALREMDVLARLGNGEFIVMLPGNTAAEAGQILKRMRITMSALIVPMKDRELHVRFRHSIAELMQNETAQELVVRARQGLAVSPAAR